MWEPEEPRATALPLHAHTEEDEQMVILEGEGSVRVGKEAHRLIAGGTVALPRGTPHAHRVDSEIARILTVATPGSFERLFLEYGSPGDAPPRRPPDEVLISAAEGARKESGDLPPLDGWSSRSYGFRRGGSAR